MERLVRKYADRLVAAGLAEPGAPLVGGLDAELVWNRDDPAQAMLEEVFDGLNINSLLLSRPAEPYRSIIEYLADEADGGVIQPSDCETRTFLHDLPVAPRLNSETIIAALSQRKSVIAPGEGMVTFGTVSPEQAFVVYSSVCFACFVKFFSDYLAASRRGELTDRQRAVFEAATARLEELPETFPPLAVGPFENEEQVYRALCEAGRLTVQFHLVDSYFGNISYRFGETLYISQTTSSLDELEGLIDPVPLDGSSCAGVTSSIELTAHREVIERTGHRALLHGHPKFAVILSMDCDRADCELVGQCHIKCPHPRQVGDVPIVPGEAGSGRWGLCNTLPPAILGKRGAIVYGHGLFAVGHDDFNEAFANLLDIEKTCRDKYFRRVDG